MSPGTRSRNSYSISKAASPLSTVGPLTGPGIVSQMKKKQDCKVRESTHSVAAGAEEFLRLDASSRLAAAPADVANSSKIATIPE